MLGARQGGRPGALEFWSPGALEPWNSRSLGPWNSRDLEPWSSNPGALELRDLEPPFPPGWGGPAALDQTDRGPELDLFLACASLANIMDCWRISCVQIQFQICFLYYICMTSLTLTVRVTRQTEIGWSSSRPPYGISLGCLLETPQTESLKSIHLLN